MEVGSLRLELGGRLHLACAPRRIQPGQQAGDQCHQQAQRDHAPVHLCELRRGRAGVQVPQGMAVVTFDDFPTDLTIDPFLTSAAQPAYDMGYRATQLLLGRVLDENDGPSQEILLPVEVIIRQSSNYTLPKI